MHFQVLWYSACLPASAIGTVKAASVNYALTATATASGSETSAFGPEKAKDGDTTTKTSRWASEERDASESNPHWLAMDLGEVKTVNSVIITWERRNPNQLCNRNFRRRKHMESGKNFYFCSCGKKADHQSG